MVIVHGLRLQAVGLTGSYPVAFQNHNAKQEETLVPFCLGDVLHTISIGRTTEAQRAKAWGGSSPVAQGVRGRFCKSVTPS